MKALIWIGCFIGASCAQVLLKYAGIEGALPAIMVYGGMMICGRLLCEKYEEKQKKESDANATISILDEVSDVDEQAEQEFVEKTPARITCCRKCGEKLVENSKFCNFCGTAIAKKRDKKCPECCCYIPGDSEFCQYCGVKFENIPTNANVGVICNEHSEMLAATSNICQISDEKCGEASTEISAKIKHGKNRQCYCKLCGSAIDNLTKKCTGCGKQYFKRKFKPLYIFLIILIIFASYVGINYFQAISAMNNQEFIKSQRLFDNLVIIKTIFPERYNYVQAGVLMEKGMYLEALKAFKKMDSISVSASLIDFLKSKIYSEGQTAYRAGRLEEAKECFYASGIAYKRGNDYLLLILCKESNFSAVAYYSELVNMLDFEDVSEIIMKNQSTAIMFLTGRWESGYYYFKIEEGKNSSTYNLPHKNVQGYYHINDGIYSIESTKIFKFSIIDEDTISVYCYKDGSTHKLYRQ